MKRRPVVGAVGELPEWICTFTPADWPHIGLDPVLAEIGARRAWRRAKREWLATEAPDITLADVRDEAARRNPVVR